MITNSDQIKRSCHSKGCPNSHKNTQYNLLWRQRRRVFSHVNGHNGAECHTSIDYPTHLAPVVAVRNGCGRLWSKNKFRFHRAPHLFNGEISEDLAGQFRYRILRGARCVAAPVVYIDMRFTAEKAHHLPVESMAVSRG